MNRWIRRGLCVIVATGAVACSNPVLAGKHNQMLSHNVMRTLGSIQGMTLSVSINSDGSYSIVQPGIPGAVLHSGVEADLQSKLLRSSEYPQHKTVQTEFHDELGAGSQLIVTHTGLPSTPDLICTLRLYRDQNWGDIEAKVANTTDHVISVRAIRNLHAAGASAINLNGPASADRILSDSYSEDRPQLAIRELGDAPEGMHRAVGSQLIYNRQSGESIFLGALTSDKLLTIFHLKEHAEGANATILSYEAVATGTTEILNGESLMESPAADQVELSIQVNPRDSLSSEHLMFAIGTDYHAQLEQYGHVVRILHKARVNAPTPIGWWSWTAYYFGLNQGTAITNAEWLAENLKQLGYTYFQLDEGYQYARGEYTTADAKLFPLGISYIADQVRHNGLTFGLWTAPFEVSERSEVYQKHKEWLLHNATGQLIHIGYVAEHKDPLYVLDTTNPGAQNYLKDTYNLLHSLGLRFVKMDFMDDSAVEGDYYRPNTTAMEAQRIGLKIIRNAVGDDVILDKDGSVMLNPVGIVDAGRISQDTGHTFNASRDAAWGIAARYYMNRNFFISDPDAFTVSTQTVDDQSWHGGQQPLTLDEAKVSIALSAVSGGMFEIGDDLPTLGATTERLSLVKNTDLIDMARLGRASTPVDLMTYQAKDRQPSVFLLRENKRESILTIFNWTDKESNRSISLTNLGLQQPDKYVITDVLNVQSCCSSTSDTINLTQPPHSVRMLKLVDSASPAIPPAFLIHAPTNAKVSETLAFDVMPSSTDAPVLACHWEFGDGSSVDGIRTTHAYTHSGEYKIHVTATGLDATTNSMVLTIPVSGNVTTMFVPEDKQRSNRETRVK